ncbi:glycosyltransferase family 2 protein [Legionella sp. D16C41]|uniref:glycosyltransferase family 2 protein n=1 Tax=Legionella sp. D16C41 TaxID=3402688 RepID=UPI003AF56240
MYLSVTTKFFIAIFFSCCWLIFCIWFSLPWINDLAVYIGDFFAFILIFFMALLPGFMNMFLILAYILDKRPKYKPIEDWINISILVPSFNEEASIKTTIDNILNQDYPGEIEIIAIDNGSTDKTLEILRSYQLKNLVILEESNKGKSFALNLGLKAAKYDYIITLDADTLLWKDAIRHLATRLLSAPPITAAVAGSIYVRNSRETFMTRVQEWDYFNAIAGVKRMQSLFQATLVAQGALSLYKKSYIEEVGGWPHTVGEDIVLTWGLLSKGYRIDFAENAIAFTTVPTNYRNFFHQRSRWSRGMIEAFLAHPEVLTRKRLITFIVYWNLLFPALDTTFALVYVPAVIAAFFGYFLLAGPMTLAVLPLTILMNLIFFTGQQRMFAFNKLRVRKNLSGYIYYILFYNFLMAPACIHGYLSEIIVRKKSWGTK